MCLTSHHEPVVTVLVLYSQYGLKIRVNLGQVAKVISGPYSFIGLLILCGKY